MTSEAPRRRRAPRTQIHPRLTAELGARLRDFANGKGVTQGAVIQDALATYFDGGNDRAAVLARLDRQSQALARLRKDFYVLGEAFGVFVQIWFAHAPRIQDAERAGAERAALSRFEQFAEHVAARIGSGKWVMHELGRKRGGEADELEATTSVDGNGV
jgi:hypothetical protein